MKRVQIPAYTDRWMMGDRYGDLVEVIKEHVYFDNQPTPYDWREIAVVRLDKSGLTIRVDLADCKVL